MPKQTPKTDWPLALSTVLYALLLGCALTLAALGGSLYAALSDSRSENAARRAGLSYLCARIAAADEAGAVTLAQGPDGDALILAEPLAQTGYETRIYWYDGALVEEYRPAGSDYAPAAAQRITETTEFSVVRQGALLRLQTGEGSAAVALHSTGGEG